MSEVADDPVSFRPGDGSLVEPPSDDFPVVFPTILEPHEPPASDAPAFAPTPNVSEKKTSHKVCLLGSTAAGKTCFLAGLAVLGEPNRAAGLQVHAAEATKRRLNELGATLARGEWPAATNQTELLKLSVLRRGRIVDLVVVDYPGGDFERGVGALDADLAPVLDAHFRDADALLLLFDPQLDVLPQEDEDPSLREQRVRRQDAFLQAVRERAIEQIRAGRPTPDVACVLTKADRWPELTDARSARRFVEKHAPHLLEKLRTLGYRTAFFPVSSVGETSYAVQDGVEYDVPLTPVEPRGYEPLFDWIVARRAAKTPWPRVVTTGLKTLAALAVVSALALLVPWTHDQRESQRAFAALNDSTRSDGERIRGSRADVWLFPAPDELAATRSAFIEGRLDLLAARIDRASGDAELREGIGRLEELKKAEIGSHRGRLDELKTQAAQRIEKNFYDRVVAAYRQRSGTFQETASDYLETYASGAHSAEVRKLVEDERQARRTATRQRIKNLPTETGFQLENKAEAIDAYLVAWPSEPEAERRGMKRAAEIARMFAAPREYTIRLKKSGKLNTPYNHTVMVWVNEKEAFQATSKQAATEVNWWGESFRLRWKVGDPVDVALIADGFSDVNVGRLRGVNLFGLWVCHGRKSLQFFPGAGGYATNPYIDLTVDGLSDSDWVCVSEYLSPGAKW